MGFSDRLKERREYLHISRSELAKRLNITASAVGNYENGVSFPKEEILYEIFKVLKVDPNYLWQDDIKGITAKFEVSYPEREFIKKYRSLDSHGKEAVDGILDIELSRIQKEKAPVSTEAEQKTASVIYFDDRVSAGDGWNFLEGGKHQLTLVLNETTRKADYAVMVAGNSMLPLYKDGDILLVREQPAINEGEIGIFTAEGKAYVKQKGPDRLISINDGYPDVRIPDGVEAVCQGKVVGVLLPEWIVDR